ncbi:hypothetical protein QJS10_CPB11g01517 [Acorus calamus]|uniref:Uncharacterized protein n=1 Tax=Acorus calamus TaxID=4465 RepID=A0AAV9DRU4_ACOCL|nr:hypothetical protein QJS10_CPB11g01517 [Acorus calamus]
MGAEVLRSHGDQDAWFYDMGGCMRSRSRPSFYAPSADESHGQGVRAPKGYVPVVVGRGREQETVFMVHTKLFNHPSFVAMLERVAEERHPFLLKGSAKALRTPQGSPVGLTWDNFTCDNEVFFEQPSTSKSSPLYLIGGE